MTESKRVPADFNVLLLAPNWLGDVVMFSALLEFLHRRRPLPHGRRLVLDLAVRKPWVPLFKNDSRLNKLIVVDRQNRHGGLLGGWKLGEDLRSQNPDAVILGPPSLRAGIAGQRSGAGMRIGFRGDGRSLLLSHSLCTPERGLYHHSEELVSLGRLLLESLGTEDPAGAEQHYYPVLEGCNTIAPERESTGSPFWIFAPGATYGSAKSWPLSRGIEFVKAVLDEGKVRLVILGDSSATAYARGLAEGLSRTMAHDLSENSTLVDLTGRTDLTQVVSILKAARAFVGIDSGLMHLAAALQVPTVGIFGSSNPDWTSPRGIRTRAVSARGFKCRPCYRKECNQSEFCLDTISSAEVITAVDELLSSKEE